MASGDQFRPTPPPEYGSPAWQTELKMVQGSPPTLGCLTEVGTANGRVGSRTASEPAFFEIEATDGGHGGGAAGDGFVFTVFFDPERAPVNHGIFGPNPIFTGELVTGEVTTAAPSTLPLLAGATPAP